MFVVRNGLISCATLNNLTSYSNKTNDNNKHPKLINTASMNDLSMSLESITTPIRFNKKKLTTPISTQYRRALGLVNHNSNHISSINDFSTLKDYQHDNFLIHPESLSQNTSSHPQDDLPHKIHFDLDTFDDLIPTNERIERMIINRTSGINVFNYYDNNENRIRYQSPVSSYVDLSTLHDMIDIHN